MRQSAGPAVDAVIVDLTSSHPACRLRPMRDLSVPRRITAVIAVSMLLAAATGLPHEAADHDGERAHVEIPHGGHGVVVELSAAQVRGHAPPPILCLATASPDWLSGPPLSEFEEAPRRPPDPRSHPPPQPRRARAPPLS